MHEAGRESPPYPGFGLPEGKGLESKTDDTSWKTIRTNARNSVSPHTKPQPDVTVYCQNRQSWPLQGWCRCGFRKSWHWAIPVHSPHRWFLLRDRGLCWWATEHGHTPRIPALVPGTPSHKGSWENRESQLFFLKEMEKWTLPRAHPNTWHIQASGYCVLSE